MSQLSYEIKSYVGQAQMNDEEYLEHYGMPRRSGRYPYGSGKDPYQRTRDFLGRVEELKKTGWTETPKNIKKEFGITTTQYRLEKSIATNERRALNVATAKRLRDKEGMGPSQIGREMGVRESVVRSWLNQDSEQRMLKAKATADLLKDKLKYILYGSDVPLEFNYLSRNGNTRTKMDYFEGIITNLERRQIETTAGWVREWIEGFMVESTEDNGGVMDPMYASQWQILSGFGNIGMMTNYAYNYSSWNTMLQMRNTMSTPGTSRLILSLS